MPCWLPPDPALAGLHHTNVDRALATGLRCRPIDNTVTDTWEWLRSADRGDSTSHRGFDFGLDPAKEQAVLDAWFVDGGG